MSSRPGETRGAFRGDAEDEVALHRYRTLVDTIADGIDQRDSGGYFVAVNDVVVRPTGYSRDERLGEGATFSFTLPPAGGCDD